MDLQTVEKMLDEAIKHLTVEFSKISAGRASTSMVDEMLVKAYGQEQPMKNVAAISTPDPGTILINPWDKAVLADVEKAIRDRTDMGFNPTNDGTSIWIKLPQATEDRRKELVKVAHQKAEESKISIRNARHDLQKHIKNQVSDKEISEDEGKAMEGELQEKVDAANKNVEEHLKIKEKDIMTI
ncbi:MAG: ribosome recycling factor [Candidatus Gracilibacteria bacterium]|nr:ribosome recycling factor [Candidatus Gracilibacteria bacterium]